MMFGTLSSRNFFSTHVRYSNFKVMKYMAADANPTVCKDFFLLFCSRRVGHICPIRLFLSQPSGTHMSLSRIRKFAL